ncbi:hypothetical protein HDF16_005408 [Granulicella aggregans]|uniref:Uncharacterized protein n=1 Tax=Granulicella aggregans TaxID=474949 RepID=A0A7W7ZIZ2_9BACT|nr:hypothetical protein [Granulicella aggregans]
MEGHAENDQPGGLLSSFHFSISLRVGGVSPFFLLHQGQASTKFEIVSRPPRARGMK